MYTKSRKVCRILGDGSAVWVVTQQVMDKGVTFPGVSSLAERMILCDGLLNFELSSLILVKMS